MANTQNTHNLGYLVIWRMADIAAPYADLEQLAQQTGFSDRFVPSPPHPKHAWEKATNLRKQKLDPPQNLVNMIQLKYGCTPMVRVETKIVDVNVRHIVRSLIIKAADNKDRQLDMESVAILQFDDDRLSDVDKFQALYHPDFDSQGASNGSIDQIIQRMSNEYDRQLTMADGQDVRYKIRDFLASLRASCLADGTYFIPDTVPGADSKLIAFQDYILGLEKYKATQSTLTCQIYKVMDDGSAFAERNRDEVKEGVINSFKGQLANLLKAFSEKDGRGEQATANRIQQAGIEFLEVKSTIKLYQEALQDDLQALEDMFYMCQNAMLKAQDMVEVAQ